MDTSIGSIVNNLSKYTIGKIIKGDANSKIISRGRKKIALYALTSSAKGSLMMNATPRAFKKEGNGFYFPAIEISSMSNAMPYNNIPDVGKAYDYCLISINGTKDLVLLAEQIHMIKAIHKGKLEKVIEDIKEKRVSLGSGHLEYLALIEETADSNAALRLLMDEPFVNLAFFEVLFKNHAHDHAKVFPMAQILKRLISQIDNPIFLEEVYNAGILAYSDSISGELNKVTALSGFVLNNNCISQQTIEYIAMSDELGSSVRSLALKKLREFDAYSDYSKLWMEKLFNLA